MSEPRHPIPQMEELSDAFRALGTREAADPRSRWRQWFDRRRRALGIGVIAVGLVGGGAATATQFISEGEPQRLSHPNPAKYQPKSKPEVVLTAADPAVGLPWGLALYRAKNGDTCYYVGQVRGERLGLLRNGKFRPYEGPVSAGCRRPEPHQLSMSFANYPKPRHLVVYGVGGSAVRYVRLEMDPPGAGAHRTMKVGPGNSFMFVLGDVEPDTFGAVPLDGDRRRIIPDP